ncbi:MAG: hypothetical protein M5U26_21675 [Planctomycetota bacterium]|nr:hypothetical protein [Planctomycetota bacterium]
MRIERLPNNPIIVPEMDARMESNINGPSLIRVPDWLPNPLGRYYLYFAHHRGSYIRLAYANELAGPWKTHEPGTLQLEQTPMRGHIASPDVHLDEAEKRIRMYYHGPVKGAPHQQTGVAFSPDGIHFEPASKPYAWAYFRVFRYLGGWYALSMAYERHQDETGNPGRWHRSPDGLVFEEEGPPTGLVRMRHAAVKLDGDMLTVFYSRALDAPEHILCRKYALAPDWKDWKPLGEAVSILKPELDWEGADCERVASSYGWIEPRAWQLRDPCVFREAGADYLVYSVAGEHGLAIARLYDE